VAYALILAGILLTVSGARGTEKDLYALLEGDFTGSNSFLWWIAAVGVIGALGYVKALQGLSHAFLALILIVLVLSNRGVFQQFTQAIQNNTGASVTPPATPSQSPTTLPTLSGGYQPLTGVVQ
jgi:hypothetical protein